MSEEKTIYLYLDGGALCSVVGIPEGMRLVVRDLDVEDCVGDEEELKTCCPCGQKTDSMLQAFYEFEPVNDACPIEPSRSLTPEERKELFGWHSPSSK